MRIYILIGCFQVLLLGNASVAYSTEKEAELRSQQTISTTRTNDNKQLPGIKFERTRGKKRVKPTMLEMPIKLPLEPNM